MIKEEWNEFISTLAGLLRVREAVRLLLTIIGVLCAVAFFYLGGFLYHSTRAESSGRRIVVDPGLESDATPAPIPTLSPITIRIPKVPDELRFVDGDIREEFDGKRYVVGVPTMVQLHRDIRELSAALKEQKR